MSRHATVCSTPGCPSLTPCPTHPKLAAHGSWNPARDLAAQKRFARAVKKRDGYRCRQCGATTDLRACHLRPLAAGGSYDPSNGITRCGRCDRATDPHAR